MGSHGYTRAEALGQPYSMLFSAEDVTAGVPQQVLTKAVAGGPAADLVCVRKDGSRFSSKVVITALRDRDGRPQGFVTVVRDLTELQASEAARSSSEARYRDLFDCIVDPLFVYDRETLEYIEVNDAAVAHYGYSREEFLGMTIKDIRPVEDVPGLVDMLSRSGVGHEARGIWRHQKKDGAIVHVEITARGLELGDRSACLVHARDVSARMAAERSALDALTALQQSQSLARIAGAVARLGGWAVDLIENTVTWSDEVCVLHEVPPGYRPGLEEAIEYYAPEHRAAISHAVAECVTTGVPFDLELELISAKSRRFWVRAIGEGVRDSTGRVVRLHGAFQDISAIRQGLDSLRLSEERFRML